MGGMAEAELIFGYKLPFDQELLRHLPDPPKDLGVSQSTEGWDVPFVVGIRVMEGNESDLTSKSGKGF